MAEFSVHGVHEIRVSADCRPREGGGMNHWQQLVFFDASGHMVGEVVLFLDSPEVALPLGDQPPYWGIDPSKPLEVVDGQPPF